MGRLLQLIVRNGGFFTFLLMEAFAFYIIIEFNTKQGAIFTHTMGIVSGNMLEKRQKWADYFNLQMRVDSLVEVNRKLRSEMALIQAIQIPYRDTFFTKHVDSLKAGDSSFLRKVAKPQYHFITAKVIGNSISGANNWVFLNRGSNDGLRPGMGVVTGSGIVGIVRHVDPNFSAVMSVLHRETKISVILKNEKQSLGSLVWDGKDPALMTLKYVPKHFTVKKGDPIVTSGYSEMFPRGVPVGRVEENPEPDKENQNSWLMQVRLSQDMSSIHDVYVVDNIYQTELDSLKLKVKDE